LQTLSHWKYKFYCRN